MNQMLRWIGIVLGGLVGLIVIALLAVYAITGARLSRTYQVTPEAVAVPGDAAAVERGRHLVEAVAGCAGCHGENLAGGVVIDNPPIGTVYSANLTSGRGGRGGTLTDADYVRAIRHGVRPDGKPMLIMPTNEYYLLSDKDLGAIIAYVKSVPPVDNEVPIPAIGPLGRVLFLAGALPPLPAEVIDHAGPRPTAPEVGVTAEYGGYLATFCQGCHGPDFTGGPLPGAPPDAPPAANLTPGGELIGWSEADFINTLRTGVAPSGRRLDESMPWREFGRMTDDELGAIWLYLQSLPAK